MLWYGNERLLPLEALYAHRHRPVAHPQLPAGGRRRRGPLRRHPNVWRNLRDAHPYTVPAATAWIRHSLRQRPETNFAIATEEEAIGGIGLGLQGDVHRDSAEIGYWLGEPYWGQGIATAPCAPSPSTLSPNLT